MKIKIISYLKANWWMAMLSFFIPIIVLGYVYFKMGIYPGSQDRTILVSDAFSQYSNFHASFNNVLKGKQNIFYSWNASMGLNYWSFLSYYLGGIFTPLVFFFDNIQMADYLYYLTLLKIGSLGLSFWVFANQTFKIPKIAYVVLSICYALMSYVIAFSEILMWMDALMYLPLVILGIHRVMDQKKPLVLFISYFLLFISNFYMAFIVGLFSFFYFLARVLTNPKVYIKQVPMYLITSFLVGGASMVLLLPTILDLRNNGEALTPITTLLTKATGPLDIVIKNMVGVYDTTKFGSIPFLFIGLLPLIFCVYFFIATTISLKEKLCYGSLFLLLIISFYFEPLNLFWQGMHAPNMFLFRYSFLFSFLVVLLAGYGWEKFDSKKADQLTTIILILLGLFIGTKMITDRGSYDYLNPWSLIWTIFFLIAYLGIFYVIKKKSNYGKVISVLFVLVVTLEMGINSFQLINGIGSEWNYPARHYYDESYSSIKKLVDYTKENNSSFYRMENLNPVSANDSFNYGYSGISMFSSIRNRHSSYYLNALGYRSLGTNLNIRYANNTLLMDSLIGMKYNLSKESLNKFGYKKIATADNFSLYENNYQLPLGVMTDDEIYEAGAVETQATLFNHLAETDENFFTFDSLKQITSKNLIETSKKINQTKISIYAPKNIEEPMEVEWEAKIPANKQAYFSFYPINYQTLGSTKLSVEVNGETYTTGAFDTGQYYSLGYYDKESTVRFKTIFSNLKDKNKVEYVAPDLALMDTQKFAAAFDKVKEKGIELSIKGRKVNGTVDLKQDQVLLTSIPYDKGWKAYIDGKKVSIPTFKSALLTLPIPAGKHKIQFVFLPEGLVVGLLLLIVCFSTFIVYLKLIVRKE